MEGRVVKFFDNKGYGFIIGEDGESYFFHISQLINSQSIDRGDLVYFSPTTSNKGKQARQVNVKETNKKKFITIGNKRIKLSNIKEYGSSYEYAVSKATSEGDVKQIVDTAYDKVDIISDDCGKCIEEKFSKGITELGKSLESLENNPNFKRIELSLTENGEDSPIVRYILKEDLISNIGKRLAENTVNKNNIATGLETFSGSEVHDVIIKLGGKLGKKFKPWEAVKLTKKINYLAKGLTIAGVIFSVALQIKDDVDRENAEQKMRENRRKIRTTFNEVANEMETYFKNTVKNEITDSYLTSIRSIDENIEEILRLEGNKKIEVDRLKRENQACKDLISEIQEYAVE